MTKADISGLLISVREKRIKGHFYLVETAREYGGARQRDVRDAERLQEVASGEDGRQMTLRTPATGLIGPLFKAARIALPPNVRDASAP